MMVVGQRLQELTRGPFLLLRRIREWAHALIGRFDIRVSGPDVRVGSLSGGNQQKVVVSRCLSEKPDLIVAVNPTRGLDLKATQFVRHQLRSASDAGAAIALFTTDLDELFELADRRLFMSGGQLKEAEHAGAMLGGGSA
jgi:simple sugar transport system ATP-binding protein